MMALLLASSNGATIPCNAARKKQSSSTIIINEEENAMSMLSRLFRWDNITIKNHLQFVNKQECPIVFRFVVVHPMIKLP